jgi:hypothetical protein
MKMGGFKDGYNPTQADLDNHSNQLNPNNDLYEGDDDEYFQEELDNHANQMNPNNEAYRSSRK